jgi:predicted RNA-binding Zn-ribbon protein involved in translation (DUF1610 family)
MWQGIKSIKPHFFSHNCKSCHRAGIVLCCKCNGEGSQCRKQRAAEKTAMVIRPGMQGLEKAGPEWFDCPWCKGKGTEQCQTCRGQGWQYMKEPNFGKFQHDKPMFEDYHRSRDRFYQPQRFRKGVIKGKAEWNEILDEDDAVKEAKEEEEKAKAKEAKRLRKEEKAKAEGGGFLGFGRIKKSKEEEKKKKEKTKKEKEKKEKAKAKEKKEKEAKKKNKA